jgi:hypothetical protein
VIALALAFAFAEEPPEATLTEPEPEPPPRPEVPKVAIDVAFAYGRHIGQELNVAEVAGELKFQPIPYVAIGARAAVDLGFGFGERGARGFVGSPLALKVEATPLATPTRPFVGLAIGAAPLTAGGVLLAVEDGEFVSTAWGIKGVKPMLTPEIGVDVTALRLSVQYRTFLGAQEAIAASASAGADGVSGDITSIAPGLSGVFVQLGVHLGGPPVP